jgi:hypothetical protein
MSTAKHDIELLLKKLPDDCSVEDIQYHLYVLGANGSPSSLSQRAVSDLDLQAVARD